MTIPTEAGDIYQTTNTANEHRAAAAAVRARGRSRRRSTIHGLARYQQGGIIVYGDDDNYIKLDRTATNTAAATETEFFEFIQEVAAVARNATADHTGQHRQTTFPNDFYVRIVSDGTNLTG